MYKATYCSHSFSMETSQKTVLTQYKHLLNLCLCFWWFFACIKLEMINYRSQQIPQTKVSKLALKLITLQYAPCYPYFGSFYQRDASA